MKKSYLLLCFILLIGFKAFSQNTDSIKNNRIIANSDTLVYIKNKLPVYKVDTVKLHAETQNGLGKPFDKTITTLAAEDVGKTPITVDVSPSGAGMFNMPIAVPAGISGFTPEISLAYNSQSGNGIAGYGWNIAGLSSISRIPKTRYHNNEIGGVNLDANDRFALDGQRLILKSGVYGADGAEYQTESYSNLRVFSRGVSPYGANKGPASFEVWYPDGSKAYYGVNTNSRTIAEYAISYRENALGARIYYLYNRINNVLYISNINYGILGSGLGFNFISFSYETALRSEQAYIGGESFYRDQLLNKISVSVNGTPIRHYKLEYTNLCVINYQRLSLLTEYNGDESKSFVPIYLNYGNGGGDVWYTKTISNLSLSGITNTNSSTIFADLTGNGTTDIILYPTAKNKFYSFLDMDPNSPYTQWGYEINTGYFRELFPITWLTQSNKVLSGQGLAVVQEEGLNFRFKVLSTGSVSPFYFQYEKTWNAPLGFGYYSECDQTYHEGEPINRQFVSGDFNGDGLTDIMSISLPYTFVSSETMGTGPTPIISDKNGLRPPPNENCQKEYSYFNYSITTLINLDPRVTDNSVTNTGYLFNSYVAGDRLQTADFNGDGKTDILHIKPGAMYVYTLGENNILQLLWQTSDSRIANNVQQLMGDYNGDGKQDIMFAVANDTRLFATFISKGNSFIKHEQTQPFSSSWGSSGGVNAQGQPVDNRNYLIPTDINGDNKTDVVYTNVHTEGNTNSGEFKFIVFNNMGSSPTSAPIFARGLEDERTTNIRKDAIPVVLPNDAMNTSLEVGFLSDHTLSTYEFSHNEKISVLTDVWNNYITYKLQYNQLMSIDGSNIYSTDYSQTFPYVDFENAPNLWVVSKIKRHFNTNILQQTFTYTNAVTHTEGLGFLGFGQVTRSNWHVDSGDQNRMFNTTITNPLLRGAVIKNFTSKNSWLNPTVTNTNASHPNLLISTPVTAAQTSIATNSVTLQPGFVANGNNGVFIAKVADPAAGINDGATTNDYITRTDYTYQTQTLANKVFINVPTSVATKDLLNGTNTLQLNEYDNYYNVTKATTNLSGAGTKTEEIAYDNNPAGYYIGRPVSKKTTANSAGDSYTSEEQYTYTGFLPTQIKRKGNGTSWITETLVYDNFSNITSKTITTPNSGSRTSSSTYDATGRFVLSTTDAEGMTSTQTYDPVMGTLLTKTNPYGQTESYLYDSWGKLTRTIDYLGKKSYQTFVSDGYGGLIISRFDEEGARTNDYINALGQTTRTSGRNVLGAFTGKVNEYDIYGRLIKESQLNDASQWNESTYDEYGRLKRSTSYTGKATDITYNGLSTTVSDGTKSVTTTKNALGQTISVLDPGGTINYTYYANGQLKTADYGGSIQSIEYDGWGRKIKLTDPSAGVYTYTYNDFGEIMQETTPKGITKYTYDGTGNLTAKTLNGDDTNLSYQYTYNATTKLLDQMAFTNADGNHANYSYTYDSYYRPSSTIEDNLNARFAKNFTYDDFGRLATETSQATNKRTSQTVSRTIGYTYQNGELLQSTDQATGQVISKVNSLNNKGMLLAEQQGANLTTNYGYDNFNLPQNTTLNKSGNSNPLMVLGYSFDAQRGNLNSRSNSATNWSESFTYDNLDRLKSITDNNGNQSQDYDNRGRITYNSQLGNYGYNGVGYQQTELTNPTTAATSWYTTHDLQQITYNAFKQPVNINEQGHAQIDFQYNGSLERSHMYYGSNDADKLQRPMRRHYSEDGSMEITEDLVNNTTDFIFYLNGDAYTAPAIYKEVQTTTGTTDAQLYYLHRDHLGSIVMITNQQGNVVEKRQFDAWGNVVIVTDGNGNPLTAFVITDRGYTGHEHLFSVGLIHMNGRLYDPKLHRFIQADDYVQQPFNTQNYNRYGYGLNNPLIYSDPSGRIFWLVPVLIGAAIGITTNGIINMTNDRPFFQGAFKAGVIGGITGLISFGIGNLAASSVTGTLNQVAFQTLAHGSLGAMTSMVNGGSFLSGFASGAVGSLGGWGAGKLLAGASGFWNAAGTVTSGAVLGGIGSEISGGNFWDGVKSGAISAGLNHVLHNLMAEKEYIINGKKYDYEGLKEYYATVIGESGNNILEAQGIGEVILNRIDDQGSSLTSGFVNDIGGAGQYDAIGGKIYNEIMSMKLMNIIRMKPNNPYYARSAGASSALSNWWNLKPGITNGAYFWNATWQRDKPNVGFNWRSYNRGVFSISAEFGSTTFFKYTNPKKTWP